MSAVRLYRKRHGRAMSLVYYTGLLTSSVLRVSRASERVPPPRFCPLGDDPSLSRGSRCWPARPGADSPLGQDPRHAPRDRRSGPTTMKSVDGRALSYAVITPARNEERNLGRLADALASQTCIPRRWLIVENGSTDGTLALCHELSREHSWISVVESEGTPTPVRGAPIVRAINAGLAEVDKSIDIVVNVDADVSMAQGYFETLLDHFAADSTLGIASGSAYELDASDWRQRHVTGGTVWGATRAYRRACLDDIWPLEERHGWDGLDQLAARAQGWTTRTLTDLQFLHHRPEGERDGSRWSHWQTCGDTAYYMGYRPWYLVMRAVHQARTEITGLALIAGYTSAAVRRAPRWQNEAGRQVLRDDQSLGNLGQRWREAVGRGVPTSRRPAGTDSS